MFYLSAISPRALGLIAVALAAGGTVSAQTLAPIQPFLEKHCIDCHSGDTPEGGFDLEKTSDVLDNAEVLRRWTYLHDRVDQSEMPPASAAQPNAEAKAEFLKMLGDALTRADLASRKTVMRRLNRDEYENTVRDMFGIYVDVQRLLPKDASEQGFDTTGSALSLSTEQMLLYVEAADLVLDRVWGPPNKPAAFNRTVNFATTPRGIDESERKLADGVVLFSGAKHLPLYDASVPQPGLYRVRVKVRAEQSERAVVMHVKGGNTGAIEGHNVGFFEAPPGKDTVVEFTDRALESHDCLSFGLVGGYPWWSVDEKKYKGPGLFLGDISIEGPIEPWPPPSQRELIVDVDPATGKLDDVRAILLRQLALAFRRDVEEVEVEPFVALAQQAFDEGLSFEKALRRGLKGILCSPEFLFLEERSDEASRVIDNFALASRLSYFIWRSLPDEALLTLARRGELQKPEVRRAELERMLRDPKAERFITSFTGQWLRLDDIDFTVPNESLYPEYDPLLRQSMLDETRSFFREILERDLSVQNFIDSDFVLINEPLAKFYGINDVTGLKVRRVELPTDSLRGGVLTQASVLKVSADGTRTSPVLRGAWIMKHLYGTPSPPPPPTVAAIEPDIRGATTIREQLAKHRQHASCNRCHRKIDPPGFALESFDVIGGERQWYRTLGSGKPVQRLRHPENTTAMVLYHQGLDVDSSGTMPDGHTFADIRQYKRGLMEDDTSMLRALTRQLSAYSLGRQLGFSDRAEVERIVAKVKSDKYGLRTLMHEIVQSELFRAP